LRKDLESRIDKKMTEARETLLERFDGDVRKKLRIAGEQAEEAVSRRKQSERSLTGSVLGTAVVGRRQLALAAKEVRSRAHDAVSHLALDGSTLPAKLENLLGKEGWWFAYRFELSGLKPEERLVHIVVVKHGESYRALPIEDAELLVRVKAEEEDTGRVPSPNSPTLVHEQALLAAKDALVRAAERASALELDAARERNDRFAEDCLFSPRQQVDRARAEWEEARAAVFAIEDPSERVKARAKAERQEREYRKKLQALRVAEEQRFSEKDRTMAALAQKAKVVAGRTLVASAYFWVQ
jgi:hypothetical protein